MFNLNIKAAPVFAIVSFLGIEILRKVDVVTATGHDEFMTPGEHHIENAGSAKCSILGILRFILRWLVDQLEDFMAVSWCTLAAVRR